MDNYENIYFIGAGGIGMAALERYFIAQGKRVAGYDRTPSDLTRALEAEGVEIVFDDDPALIPDFMRDAATTLVVYTPAVGDDNKILRYFMQSGFEPIKRARLLGMITRTSKGICFAGTHGKTTTSSMAAHILHQSPTGCNAFLGGVLRNYGSNLLLSATSPFSVIEADEYDRSFHQLSPHIAVITATDPDHLDIYGTEEAYLESFRHFTELIRPGGTLIVHTGLKLQPNPGKDVKLLTYSKEGPSDYYATNIRRSEGRITFDLVTPHGIIENFDLGVPVEINIENAVAALAAIDAAGVLDEQSARHALSTFMGPKRRFEFWMREPGRAIIDDYAHHPDELRASIMSVKALYPSRKLTVAFQPHLYSRTRDFASEFAAALSLADCVVLTEIYPARELPIPGVDSQLIFDKINSSEKVMIEKKDLQKTLKNSNFEVLLTVGAGDINLALPGIVADASQTDKK